jgi:hypothetical protein
VQQNNVIYKGYKLTAQVSRVTPDSLTNESGPPVFTASIIVKRADANQEVGDEYQVPFFAEGNVVFSPREAVHEAINHGRAIVDALAGVVG